MFMHVCTQPAHLSFLQIAQVKGNLCKEQIAEVPTSLELLMTYNVVTFSPSLAKHMLPVKDFGQNFQILQA